MSSHEEMQQTLNNSMHLDDLHFSSVHCNQPCLSLSRIPVTLSRTLALHQLWTSPALGHFTLCIVREHHFHLVLDIFDVSDANQLFINRKIHMSWTLKCPGIASLLPATFLYLVLRMTEHLVPLIASLDGLWQLLEEGIEGTAQCWGN